MLGLVECGTHAVVAAAMAPYSHSEQAMAAELVQQELWGLLLAHFAIRQLIAQAAWGQGLGPDRLSFTHAVRVIKRKMSNFNVRHRGAVLHQLHHPTLALQQYCR